MRKYDVKGLRLLSASVSGQLETARAIRIALGSDLAALETPDAKLKYTATHLSRQRSSLSRAALDKLRDLNKGLSVLTKAAAKERPLWSKSALLMDSYQDSDATDRATRAVEQSTAATRGLLVANRLSRMSDDQFKAFVDKAVDVGDTQALILASQEGEIRGGLSGLAARQAVDSLPCDEAGEAEGYYTSLSNDIQEAAALEEHIERPANELAYARVRSAEISRAASEDSPGDEKKEDATTRQQLSSDAPDIDFASFVNPSNDAA